MNKNNTITRNQYFFVIQSAMIGIGIITLASGVTKKAQQSGWIAVILAGIYPILCVLLSYEIYKDLNFVEYTQASEQIYGKFLTKIFTFLFSFNFIFLEAAVVSGLANELTFSTTKFLSPYVLIFITSALIYYNSVDGLKIIARLSELVFYLTIFIFLIPIYFINKGDITNVLPIVSDYGSIIKAIPTTFFAYSGVELSIAIIPMITNKMGTKGAGIAACIFTTTLYTFVTFVTILFIGWKLTSQLKYPFLYLVATTEIPVISNFEPLFIFIWGNKIFQTAACMHFGATYYFSEATKIPYKISCAVTCILAALLGLILVPEHNRGSITDKVMPFLVGYIILWLITAFLISKFKKVKKNAKA
ncbi:GerAB/ArcD/ProY family transporter [Thermobrachium celere]|uniref:GerAB/ArcD/ProY family transporter n=1 Tax=Thermobrachium celere TaxID=53422 RepID=UPI001940B3CE|nr:GerAB/ArcD/ProY family transporter [Thermobrachium celere]GFR35469.1 germination protein [Thermobrachium celere]